MSTLKTPDETFYPETDTIDLAPIRKKQFIVAINSGDRQQAGLVPESIKGPFNFYDMVAEVGNLWEQGSHYAKVIVLNGSEYADWLDEATVDYIITKHVDILFQECFLEADGLEQDPDAEYECGLVKNTGIPASEPKEA